LHIADASIMPTVVSDNTNTATITIGERAADMVRQKIASRRSRWPVRPATNGFVATSPAASTCPVSLCKMPHALASLQGAQPDD